MFVYLKEIKVDISMLGGYILC